jgi:Helix-turn-helix domain
MRKRPKRRRSTTRKQPEARGINVSNVSTANPDQHLDESQAAALLGVTVRSLQKWRLTGDGPPFVRMSSRCVRYRVGDLQRWSASLRRISTSDLGGADNDASPSLAARGPGD